MKQSLLLPQVGFRAAMRQVAMWGSRWAWGLGFGLGLGLGLGGGREQGTGPRERSGVEKNQVCKDEK